MKLTKPMESMTKEDLAAQSNTLFLRNAHPPREKRKNR